MLAEHLTLSLVMAGMVGLVVLAWVNFSEIRKPNLFQSPHDVYSRGFIAFFEQSKLNSVDMARLQKHLLNFVPVPGLTDYDLMPSREQEHFLVSIQLLHIAYVLSIDPDTGVLFGLVPRDKTHLCQHAVFGAQRANGAYATEKQNRG
jgi:hypothetical protein